MPNPPEFGPLVHFEAITPPPIPHGIIPGVLCDYAEAVAESIQVPFELPLINALGAVAACAQRKFVVWVHEQYVEPVNIFALAVLPPGERKSAVKDACRFPLLQWEKEEQQKASIALRQAHCERLVQEEAQKALIQSVRSFKSTEERREIAEKLSVLKAEQSALPVAPRLLADDATPEALAALMAEQNQRIAMLEAEGGFFDTLAGRYSNGVPNLDAVLKSWSGEAVRIDRRHAEAVLLDSPALTLILTAQPDILNGIAEYRSFRGRGMLGRLLFFLPQSRVGLRNTDIRPVPDSLKQDYALMLRNILNMPWHQGVDGELTPYCLKLDEEARLEWQQFAAEIELALAEGQSLADMRDWGGKLPGQALRVAGLYHLSLHDRPEKYAISASTMRNVLNLAQILTEHAKAAYGLMGADDALSCARAIIRLLLREPQEQFTARAVFERLKGRWKKMAPINAGLAVLEERGFVVPLADDRVGKRKPRNLYAVNPALYRECHL